MTDIVYKSLCYRLYATFFYVHNCLGSQCKEKQYQDALELKLKADKWNFEREKDLMFDLGIGKVAGNRVDFLIDNKIAVDLKASKYITREDYRQMIRYLKSGKLHLGLVVNFRCSKVIIKRVVNSDFLKKDKPLNIYSKINSKILEK